MKTLVFEQWQGGHYFNYLECLVPRLASLSQEVVVAITQRAAASAQFERQLGHLRKLPNVRFDLEVALPTRAMPLIGRYRLAKNVADAISRNKPDFVFLTSADEQLWPLPLQSLADAGGALRATQIEAVIHYKAYTANATLRERIVSLAQRTLARSKVFNRLNFVNFLQFEDAQARYPVLAGIARVAGDPVPQPARMDRTQARRTLGLATDGRYVGMIGGLDARKAVPATLAAFRIARLRGNDRLLLAGAMAPDHSALIRSQYDDLVRSGRLVLIDRFLSECELTCGFAALDVHCSAYVDFSGLSSLLLKSVAAGVPVIAADRGWSGAVVRRFGIGHTVEPRRTDDFASVLQAALDASTSYCESPAVGRLLQFHSVSNFTEGLVERAAAFAGQRGATEILPWSWVQEALPPERRHQR